MPFLSNIHLYQIVILLVAVVMIYQGVESFLKHQSGQSVLKLLVRLSVWGGMAVIAIFPQVSNVLSGLIGIEGNINAVILTGFLLVFVMIFKLLSAIERLEQHITSLTRQKTLKSAGIIKSDHE